MNNYIVETKELVKDFKDFKAVKGIDLKIKKGTIYGFLGPNGAGKSTTIRMLLGLVKPTSGSIKVLGKNIEIEREEILKNVGALVESPSYYAHLTAYENLEITRKILKLQKSEITRVLDFVKLSEVRNKKVKEFSLGMKQRLGIAQALMGDPELIILDEPTNGLDPSGIHEIRDLIKALPKEKGSTVIVSSHILSEIELMADEIGIIKKGELLYQGNIEELRQGNTSKILVQVSNKEEAIDLLIKRGYKIKEENEKLWVKGESLTAARLCRELVLSGYDVNYLSEEGKSLEDMFLSLTVEERVC
ncbi:ABC transporter ATP-binding protein [Clostridium felsineum]|uniref:Bacitracin transport ATP-binding protein BcrA n=1 Tax=Clostridium felsineum TaxID=36839 RepID=A0A1S8L997_9CLOT|nr:ABC transporter ATP-binding protein [Clostridium felsineum]URZ05176.1 Bacitracin transport ATP-binding protein BcrA [Clostridium felsineum]URZ10217.1 Bacitracin transport ATP-binding protein BcrA [Clostridium felsineum]